MKLLELFENVPVVKGIRLENAGVDIKGIANNSNEVRSGYLFIAVKGTRTDGSQFIDDAISRGAVAIVCEPSPQWLGEKEYPVRGDVSFIQVKSTVDTIWQLGKRFYGDPSSNLKIIGITGTNGKTTTSYLIKNIFQVSGVTTGLLGTIDYVIGDRKIPAILTTPDILKVNQYLSQMVTSRCKACVMEVSSHALDQGRVDGINFQVGIYTNLGSDHLDYHKTIDSYLDSKTKLFKKLNRDSWAVINMDDPYSINILRNTLAKVIGYGIRNVSCADMDFKIRAKGIRAWGSGMKFSVYAYGFETGFQIETKLIGYHNLYNILAATGASLACGISISSIKEGISITEEVPGRLEKVDLGQPFNVFIDYAHTPDALENVLNTVRGIAKNRVILVFGCGGDRDKNKRPLMGRIAGRLSDYAIITTDNPRGENPMQIIAEIEKGFVGDNYKIIPDRKDAIKEAIDISQPEDILIIAGKGHENYQILKNTVVSFSDRAVVEECLKEYAYSIS